MTSNMDSFQALLATMRNDFLAELPERCDRLDELILLLEKFPADRDAFNELYRAVHSLKGSGGTHGLHIITTVCHQLENQLTETEASNGFGEMFASRALAYVDLLRKVEELALQANPNYSEIEKNLASLRQSSLQSRKSVMIVESSPMMSQFYQEALKALPLQLTTVDNGITALERLLHEQVDLVIVARETKELNGIALMAALRSTQTANHLVPAILVSSKLDAIPTHAGFNAVLLRDRNLANTLLAAVKDTLKI